MKTYKINTVDELSKMNFILGKVEDLPSALKVELHKNALDNSDQVLYRMFHNKYQVVLPIDENELETSKIQALIFDVNKGESVIEDIDTTNSDLDTTKVAVVLDTYSAKDAISDYNKLKLYSKVNPTAEDWNKCTEKFSEILEGKDENSVTEEDIAKLKVAYESIPDVTVLNDEVPESEVPAVEPETKVELESVTSTNSTEPEVPSDVESAQSIVSDVSTSVDPSTVVEKVAEVEPQLDTNSSEEPKADEPKELEVPEEPKKVEPEIDLKAFMERLNRYEEKLDFILKKLGIDPDEVNSLVSYGQKMKALAKVDMGGELL